MDKPKLDPINNCYEALLDLKCIFPSWCDLQDNFFYHWKKILNSSVSTKESDNKVVKTYETILEPMLKSKAGEVESKTAVEMVRNLDNYRKKEDEEFEPYLLEEVLSRDSPEIKLPKKPARTASKKKTQELHKVVLAEETSGGHSYGTRRSKMLSGEGDFNGKSQSGSFSMGEHLKKGFFSDYVWELNPGELKDEFDE